MGKVIFVNDTISGLKKRLDSNNLIYIQGEEGYVDQVKCSFNDPATLKEIESFSNQIQWELPEDYKQFLLIHNGCRLFFHPRIGGGIKIFSLQKILENYTEDMPLGWIPVASYEGDYLIFIDLKKSKEKNNEYLIYLSNYDHYRNAIDTNLDFQLWLDRLIMSQGVNFLNWSIYTSSNYYKSR